MDAIRGGKSSRADLMSIESLRHQTWAVVNERLGAMVKGRLLIASKTGWRVAP